MKNYVKPEVEVVKFTTMEAIAKLPGLDGGSGNSDTEWGEDE